MDPPLYMGEIYRKVRGFPVLEQCLGFLGGSTGWRGPPSALDAVKFKSRVGYHLNQRQSAGDLYTNYLALHESGLYFENVSMHEAVGSRK